MKRRKVQRSKVAIVHDSFLYMGGAERVATALLRIFPQADLYSAFFTKEALYRVKRFCEGRIIASPLSNIVKSERAASFIKPLVYYWWEHIDLSGYDLVISSSHSFSAKSVMVPKRTLHMSYIHSPPRFLYGLSSQVRWVKSPLSAPFLRYLRKKDIAAAQRPDVVIANSKVVQKRIWQWYRRKSTVIYPPVAIPPIFPKRRPRYFLSFSHLLRQKNIDLAVRACNTLGAPLVVVGDGPESGYLHRIAGPTIQFRGVIADDEISKAYEGAIALLYPSEDEDFGMVPVEAMAHGVPVVAYRSAGVTETVVDGKTGILFSPLTVASLLRAMHHLPSLSFSPQALRARAMQFSEATFYERMRDLMRNEGISIR